MPSRHDPADSLADIVENAGRVERYLAGMSRDAFEGSGLTRDAVERCLERVCEAAHRLGDEAGRLMPGHPWGDIRGMGNRLRHAYDRISVDVLWNAPCHDLPGLAADAGRALERLRGERSPVQARKARGSASGLRQRHAFGNLDEGWRVIRAL